MAQINQLSAIENPNIGDQLPLFSTGNGDARKLSLGVLAAWMATAFTGLTVSSFAKITPVSVANLPSPSVAGVGAMAFVTDAVSNTFHSTVVGGGALNVPVYSDGTNWKVG